MKNFKEIDRVAEETFKFKNVKFSSLKLEVHQIDISDLSPVLIVNNFDYD